MLTRIGFALAFATACAFALASSNGAAVEPPVVSPRIELPRAIEGLLPSGVRVVVAPRSDGDAVAIHLALVGGASRESESERGAARVAAATLAAFEPAGFNAYAKKGGVVTHDASLDRIELSVLVPKADFERALASFSTALSKCKFEDGDIVRGKAALPKAGADNVSKARRVAAEAAFSRVPSQRGVDLELANKVSGEAVRAFAASNVRSAGAVLAICGDVDPGDAFNHAREVFAIWARTAQPVFERGVEPRTGSGPVRATAEVDRGRAVSVLWPTVDRDDPAAPALRFCAELLRQRFTNANVVLDESISGGARLAVSLAAEWDAIDATRNFEQGVLAFATSLDATKLDLSAAREALASAVARELSTVQGVAARMARDGADLDDVRAFEREYAACHAVTPEAVVLAAKRFLDPTRAAIGQVGSVQRSAIATTDAITRGKIENGPSWIVDRRAGSGWVSVALRNPSTAVPPSIGSLVGNAALSAYLAEVAVESGAAGEVDVAFDETEFTVAFDVFAPRAEGALRAVLAALRGEASSAEVLTRAKTRAAAAITAWRKDPIGRLYEHANRGSAFLDEIASGPEAFSKFGVPELARFTRGSDVTLVVVGDLDPTGLPAICGAFSANTNVASAPVATGGSVTRSQAPIHGATMGGSAIVAKTFVLEPRSSTESAALDTLATHGEWLAELREFGFEPVFTARSLRFARTVAPGSDSNSMRLGIVALEVAPKDVGAANAAFDSLLDAIAKRGITSDDLLRATKASEKASFERSLTPRGQALRLAGKTEPPAKIDPTVATAFLRRALSEPAGTLILEPTPVAPGPRAAIDDSEPKDDPAAPKKTPLQMTQAELAAEFGENLLVPDPLAPTGTTLPKNARTIEVLRRWYGDPPRSLNMSVGKGDANVVDSLCEYIGYGFGQRHRGDPGKWAPGVADYASWSAEKDVVTVRLRPDLTWQFPAVDPKDPRYAWLVKLFENGAPRLTAHDVAYTHRVFMDPGSQAGGLRSAYDGSTVRVLDDLTYQVTWKTPTTLSLVFSLNFQTVLPEFLYSRDESGERFHDELLGKGALDHWYNNRMCGYGPYEFVRLEPNERIVLRRKADFPLFQPAVEELRWEILRDPEQVVQRFFQGQLDGITLQPQQYKQYWVDAKEGEGVRRKGVQAIPYVRAEYFYIGWNCRKPQFKDPAVRRALAYAVNREAIVTRAYLGAAELVEGHFRREHPHRLEREPQAFDLDVAAAKLEEAGWEDVDGNGVLEKSIDGKDVEFRITFTTYAGSADGDMIAAILKSDLAKLGIALEVIALPWDQMQEAIFRKHDFDSYLGNWGTAYEIDPRAMFHSKNAVDGLNYGGYSNPRIDELAESYLHTFDPAERLEIAHEFQRILADDPPYVFLLRRERMTVLADFIDNVRYSAYRPQLLSLDWCRKPE